MGFGKDHWVFEDDRGIGIILLARDCNCLLVVMFRILMLNLVGRGRVLDIHQGHA
jgi:hypothetical protein